MDWNSPSLDDLAQYDPAEVFAAGLRLHNLANTAYPIGHLTTMRPYKIPRSAVQSFTPRPWQEIERMALYVHIPFCEKRCGYCEYTVMDPQTNRENEAPYFDLLLKEFELYRQAIDSTGKTLIGFDIGGGTPSAVQPKYIEAVVKAAYQNFRLPQAVDISIETTPRIAALQAEKITAYRQMGIRRISMGVQTVNPALLMAVGREQGSMIANEAAAAHIRQAGFEKFNVDVMYGFAGQSAASLQATLEHVIRLQPEFVTLYRMRYKGTRLAHQAGGVDLSEVIRQARLAKHILRAAGYAGSPGKNTFSRLPGDPGTSHYLTERVIYGAPYLGLGLGAQSLAHKSLAYNSGAADKRLEHYRRQVEADQLPVQDIYYLSPQAAMGKMISVSFYFGEVHLDGFARKFGVSLEAAFPAEIDFVLRDGLMEYWPSPQEPQTLRLTEWGEDQVNGVIALFYAGAVKRRLLELAGLELAENVIPNRISV